METATKEPYDVELERLLDLANAECSSLRAERDALAAALMEIERGDERPGHANRMGISQAAKIARAALAKIQ